jgi:hypothetical protein
MPSRSSIIGHPAMRGGQVLQSPPSDTGPGKLTGARDCQSCLSRSARGSREHYREK